MAYDSLRGKVVLFGGTHGGNQANQSIGGATWEWDGTTWKQMANSSWIPMAAGPSPRYGHALAYDSSRQRVVLFGGQTTPPGAGNRYLDDTWEWDGAAWNQVVNAGPSARSNHAMVYDSARGRIVLYGGFDGSGKSDTWERNGALWIAINSSTGPGIRSKHAMAYDHQHQRSVLFGGLDANGASTNDTWEWDGAGWTQAATTGPSSRFGHAMAFDETCGKVILFGGFDQTSQRDTWAWNGATWFLVTNSGPAPRRDQAMAYDSIRGTIVMFGGRQDLHHSRLWDTWEWRSPCDDEAAELDANGEVIFPGEPDPSEPVTEEAVDKDMGYVSDLYPSYDTRTDAWYKDFLCNPSIGGTIPPEASDPNLTEELRDEGITGVTADEISTSLATWEDMITDTESHEADRLINAPPATGPTPLGPYTPPSDPHCTSTGCKYIFGGRDIVFVHGLRVDPLFDKIFGTNPGALTEWPQDKDEFYGTGYWKRGAEGYWKEHIKRFLTDRGIRNRYLIVAYPSTQRLRFGVQAILAQIGDAMKSGIGVVDPSGHNDTSKFGTPSFVIISHSTGGLATDVAMRAAVKYPNLEAEYIPKFCKAHIALQGAFSGSRLATAAVAAANYMNTSDKLPDWLCPVANLALVGLNLGGAHNQLLRCPPNYTAVNNSILVDLVPLVSQLRWGSFVRDTPVRTVTVVGGHPSFLSPLKVILHPGFDDGVLSINSQVANPNTTLLWPSGYGIRSPFDLPRVFDMGVAASGNQDPGLHSPLRGIGYYIDQRIDRKLNKLTPPSLVAAGASSYISPTGMLQPPGDEYNLNGGRNPRRRYPKHYSFIQSAADHYKGSTGDGGFNLPFYRSTVFENNLEETNVITDLAIYESYGMFYPNDDQPVLTQVPALKEEIRGRRVKKGKRRPRWRWKRMYHLMEGWRNKVQMDYVHDLVLRDTGYACPPPDAADDCNQNGTPDECDIANGTSKDCNRNGIPDDCETITIPPPVITQGPTTTIGVVGQSVTFSVTATSTVPLSYQWRKNGVNLNDDGRISGTRSNTLTINPVNLSDNGFYDVVVTACDSVTSNPAVLTFRCDVPPKITTDIKTPTAGVPYLENLVVTGGCGSNTFDVSSGTLPPGLTLSPGGTISGMPVSGSGLFSFSVRVTDACGCTHIRGYSGSVTGKLSCPDPGNPYTYRAGNIDEFASPTDPASPSAALTAAFPNPTKDFDDSRIDRYIEHTFTGLPANIVKAELEVRMRPGASSLSSNDTINLAFRPSNPIMEWGVHMANLPPGQNPSQSWNPGDEARTFIFDLGNLPPNGSLPTNLITDLATKRYLDVVVQDDTTVDYIKLRIWTCYCPPITLNPAPSALWTIAVNTPYSQIFTATGGCSSSFTYSLTSGTLPSGLRLGADGLLAGTATQRAGFTFTVTATDSCGCSQSQTYTLTANERKGEFDFTGGMNEYCIWGGGGPFNTPINTPTLIDGPIAGVPINTFTPGNTRGEFSTIGLCYGRILFANDRFALKYTFNAIPVAVLSYREVNPVFGDFGFPVSFSETRRNVYGAGLSPIGLQLYFRPQSRIKPFVNTSGGFIFFKDPVPQLNGSRFNFTYDFGGGVQVFRDSRRAFTFGYKYQRISNGGRALNNPGFDGHVFSLGYSIFKAPKIAQTDDLEIKRKD